jgi:phospholipase/carboxylesterase
MKFDPQGWYLDRGRYGSLNGILIAPRSTPTLMVTLCHGFGAPGSDLVPLVEALVPRLADHAQPPAFFFPEGPIDLAEAYGMSGANAWWPLNMAMLAELAAADDFDALRKEVPPGLDHARSCLLSSIQACIESQKWPALRHVLGGFSQGSMLSVDTALHAIPIDVHGLIVWSGALICEDAWRTANAENPKRMAVYQSHGRQDPILPIGTGRALQQLLQEFGWRIESMEFDGPHTIPESAIEGAARLIDSMIVFESDADK